jgi:type I restriction enzyme, S subunit
VSYLPSGWALAKMGDLAHWGSGGTPKSDVAKYYGGNIPWVVTADLTDGPVQTSVRTITELGLAKSSAKLVPSRTVLVAMYGASIGRVGIASMPLATNQAIANAEVYTDAVMPTYLLYYLLSQRAALVSAGKGAAQPNIGQGTLKEWPIPIAPLAEQARIVAAIEEQLSRLDAGVSALERMQHNVARLRSTAFALVTDRVEKWRTLGEIAEVVGGVTKDAKRQSDPSFVEVPYLRVANVQRGYLDLSSIATIRVPPAIAEKLRLKPGDILLNEGGDRDKLGRGWVWQGQIDGCIHQNHVFRARLLTDAFDPKFISMHGNTFGRTWFEKMGKQTTNLASLSLTTLKSFPVPDLPIEQQREITAEVERQLSLLGVLYAVASQSLNRCGSLRSSILATAFSGKLVPQDSSDEPASVLLERIAAERASTNRHKPIRMSGSQILKEGVRA